MSLLFVVRCLTSGCREGDQHFLDLELPQVGAGAQAPTEIPTEMPAQRVPPATVARVLASSFFMMSLLSVV
ncbi:hypothetical protein VP06_02945 [Methylobacterium aquaticum]|uniref:Uncharacterized protein n=1 Tax=Methylobacterium aquaticum TaxID=270351 RepID=A0A0J6SYC2_9HYPH|nr:hypothetical protein VP06_02945 [Methylobacterium aquaticum]